MAANATMAMSSFDRISGQVLANQVVFQPYNDFRIQTQGGNIIQGQMNKIRVAEIMMNYQIPTIIATNAAGQQNSNFFINGRGVGNDVMFIAYNIYTYSGGGTVLTRTTKTQILRVPAGFYSGPELAAAVQSAIDTFEAANGIAAGTLEIAYDAVSNSMVWNNNDTFSGADAAPNVLVEFLVSGTGSGQLSANFNQPDLLWTLGLQDMFAIYPPLSPAPIGLNNTSGCVNLVPVGYPNVAGSLATLLPVFPPGYAVSAINSSYYTGLYTDYIDICSPTLCQNQYVRDGNTNQQSIHRDIICRLYLTSELSNGVSAGAQGRPFQIHRQFKNAKIMKWTAERSIDAIDIQMYDMFGNPLPFPTPYIGNPTNNPNNLVGPQILQCGPGNMAITFLVDEETPH